MWYSVHKIQMHRHSDTWAQSQIRKDLSLIIIIADLSTQSLFNGSFQWSESNLLDCFKCLSSVALNILLKYCYITVQGLRNTIHTVFIISIPGMTFLIIFVVSAFFGRFTIFDNSTIQFAVLISNKCPRGPWD